MLTSTIAHARRDSAACSSQPDQVMTRPERSYLTYKAGGWIAVSQPRKDLVADAHALLDRPRENNPGNQRFTIVDGGVRELGEWRTSGLLAAANTNRFSEPASWRGDRIGIDEQPDTDELACVVNDTPFDWKPLEQSDHWQSVVTHPDGGRCELTVLPVQGGIETRATVAAWKSDLSDVSREAVAKFLLAAHNHVRFTRFVLGTGGVSAISFACTRQMDTQLPDSILAVIAAHRCVFREVQLLLSDSVAKQYLAAIQ
ncbi:MAG: hypothetical protein HKN47_10965 [Pirellulaceae bacterium]|nr:hypothetical protein [Pirellulaceae bacterium]